MSDRVAEAEMVLDDELVFDEAPRHSTLLRRDGRLDEIVREGELLAGKYRVERIPGRSGLGVVVQVRHLELGQEVTLKFLVPDACAYPEFVQRFVREARAAVKIQGEHVARVTDVGRLDSGAPYMVREYLRGPDLAEVVKVRGPLPVDEAVDYLIQACEGVAEGHALGVVHRNIRPTTLVVTRRSDGLPSVKVFDFAAAESLHIDPFTERAISLVGTSAIMASLPYLPPEQIRDPHDVDFRADVYSLGAVLYELLTGRAVFAAESAPALLAMVAADVAPPMRNFRPDVPGELDHIVLRCLAKNRAIRYPALADLVLALREFASVDAAASIERVVRLGKRTSRPPEASRSSEGSDSRASVSPPLAAPRVLSAPPAPAPEAPFPPAPSAAPGNHRGPTGTVILGQGVAATRSTARQIESFGNEDVTTINPYAAYNVAGSVPLIVEPPRQTPKPPPLRTSVPPPLRPPTPVPPPVSARPEPRYESLPAPPMRMQPSAPPLRSSMSGMSRSWAAPDEPAPPRFTRKRLIGIGIVAACATLGAVIALRPGMSSQTQALAVARPVEPKPAAPAAPAVPPPAPVAEAVVPPPVAAPPAPAASAQMLALQQAVTAALQAQALVAPPAAAAAAPAALRSQPAPASRPAVARKPVATPKSSDTDAAPEKVARARPAAPGPDLFDDPR